jgi:hypothetical protein
MRSREQRTSPEKQPLNVEAQGSALYSRVRDLDIEGIVAKHKDSPYLSETTISTWYKIRNPGYSQMIGRHELFERERHSEPVPAWHTTASGCSLFICPRQHSLRPANRWIARTLTCSLESVRSWLHFFFPAAFAASAAAFNSWSACINSCLAFSA